MNKEKRFFSRSVSAEKNLFRKFEKED
jgi:hypothetical protein